MNYCKYGCGQEAKYTFKNGNSCCSSSPNKCPENKKKNSISVKESRRLEKENGVCRKINHKKIPCVYCTKNITSYNISKHENFCYLNPKNIRLCPVCSNPIKDKKATTCSKLCAQIHFRDMFNEIRKNRDMSWCDGHSYIFICFQYHERKCIICNEDIMVSVHHYDKDKNNDEPTNLTPLCPTHHMYMHSQYIYLIKECVDQYMKNFKQMFQGGSMA